MLNRGEFIRLQDRRLSLASRILYIFALRPDFQRGMNIIYPDRLCNAIVSDSPFFPKNPLISEVLLCLDELEWLELIDHEGFPESDRRFRPDHFKEVKRMEDRRLYSDTLTRHDWEGALYSLPLFVSETVELPERPFCMYDGWRPGAGFAHIAYNAGLVDYRYDESELAEFVQYWMLHRSERSQSAWERTFVKRLMRLNVSLDAREDRVRRASFADSRKNRRRTIGSLSTGIRAFEKADRSPHDV